MHASSPGFTNISLVSDTNSFGTCVAKLVNCLSNTALTLYLAFQVAALQFGDFYDMQYAKMYTIFMVQLQVCSH